MGLKVFIVGAGIGGLVASIALRKAGHEITIFERSQFKSEIGAAITITPNGAKILDHLGFDSDRAGVVEGQKMVLVNGTTLETLHAGSLGWLKEKYGYAMGYYHRVDLHHELRRLAEDVGVQIKLGSHVEEVTMHGTIKIQGHGDMTADLVVIADGVHSSHLGTITGKPEPLVYYGRSSIRALISQDKIRSNKTLAPIFGQHVPGWYIPMTMPPDAVQLVTYPCRNNEVLNVALVHHTQHGSEGSGDWNNPISPEDAQKTVQHFHPVCRELLSLADSAAVHVQPRRELLSTFTNGRLVVIGDAAHVMPPTHAQGAGTTIEEACALGVLLRDLDDSSQVPRRLKLYERLVKPRMETVQLLSHAMPKQNNEFRKQAEVIWEQSGHGQLYPDDEPFFSPAMSAFFYGFDMQAEAEAMLRELDI